MQKTFGLFRIQRVLASIALVLVLIVVVVSWIAHTYRLTGVPDISEPFDLQQFGQVDVTAADNAFELYSRASQKMLPLKGPLAEAYASAVKEGWQAASPVLRDWLDRNREALVLLREGSSRPEAVYYQPAEINIGTLLPVTQSLRDLAKLARLESLRLEAEGDPAAAWDWHRAVLRTSRHSGAHGCIIERLVGNALYVQATESIVQWTQHPGVGVADLGRALDEVSASHRMTVPASGPLKVEYLSFVNVLEHPEAISPDARSCAHLPSRAAWQLLYPAGEPELSHRAAKLAWANWLDQCDRPRPSRTPVSAGATGLFEPDSVTGAPAKGRRPDEIEGWIQSSYLARLMVPAMQQFLQAHDREEARRALLETLLALQLWHRESGTYPPSLERLVGAGIDRVPVDPFGHGEAIHFRVEQDPAEGCTIWSIGPDGVDDDGRADLNSSGKNGDILLHAKPPVADAKSN